MADLQMPGCPGVVDALMEQLLSAQVSLRWERRIISAIRFSRLPGAKALHSFDVTFQPSIDRAQIMHLYQLGFITRKGNVIFPGPADVGNTHLAISLAITAAERGRRVYYGTLSDLVLSLVEAERQGRLRERLATLRQPSLLIVDEIGYLPVSANGANLFSQLVNARYVKASTVLTSNNSCQAFVDIRFGQS